MVYDLIIIGGGPAGITAGIYAARQKLNTLLITKSFGGQVARKVVAIENYPAFEEISGLELIQRFKKHLKKQEIDIEKDEVIELARIKGRFLVWTGNKNKFEGKTIIIASGANPRPLKVPGEKEFLGRGLSYCAVCDGVLFSNKIVAVIGGGNSGFEAAMFLSKLAKKIYILEYGPEVKADQENQEIVKKKRKVKIITNVVLKRVRGNKFVKSIVYRNRKTGEEKELLLDGVFIEIGTKPATSFLESLVDFNDKGEIKVNFETYQTKTPGLFAAGDVNIGKYKQIVTACGEGSKAALAAYDYLQKLKK